MIRNLAFSDLLRLVKSSGLRKDDFTRETFFYAVIYKEIIWCLALIFCCSDTECELINTEYTLNDREEIKELSLLLNFKRKKMGDFAKFLSQNEKLIPNELREKFILSAGFNFGNAGGVLIKDSCFRFISQDEFMAEETEGSLTDEIKDAATYQKIRMLRENILALFKEN